MDKTMNRLHLVLIASAGIIAGCAASAPIKTDPAPPPVVLEPKIVTVVKYIDTTCDTFRAVIPISTDKLSRATADAIAGNNEAGAKKCGWKPPADSVLNAKKKKAAAATPASAASAPAASE